MNARYTLAALCVLSFLAPSVVLSATNFNQVLSDFESQYQIPSGCLARIAKVESGGNPSARNSESSASGLFQWLSGSWLSATKALFGSPLDLSKRFDPVEASRVTAFALRGALNKNGSLFAQAGVDTCLGLYMSHFLGTEGAARFLRAYLQNPQQNACAIFARECSLKTNAAGLNRTLADVLRSYAQKLNVGGPIAIAGNFEDAGGTPFSRSFANLNPTDFLPKNTPIPSDPERTFSTNYYAGPGGSYYPTSATPQPVSQTLGNNAPSQQGPPASLVIAQPSSISRGGSIVVSWTSVRTSSSTPCTLVQEAGSASVPLATANEGTRIVSTKEGATGTWTFTLQCTSTLGSSLPEQETSVSVQ